MEKDSPLKSSKGVAGRGSLARTGNSCTVAVAQVGGQRDEAGEPEDHGHGLDSQRGEVVMRGRHEHGREDEVGQGQPGPDGAEDAKGDLGGHRIVVVVAVVVRVAGDWENVSLTSFPFLLISLALFFGDRLWSLRFSCAASALSERSRDCCLGGEQRNEGKKRDMLTSCERPQHDDREDGLDGAHRQEESPESNHDCRYVVVVVVVFVIVVGGAEIRSGAAREVEVEVRGDSQPETPAVTERRGQADNNILVHGDARQSRTRP